MVREAPVEVVRIKFIYPKPEFDFSLPKKHLRILLRIVSPPYAHRAYPPLPFFILRLFLPVWLPCNPPPPPLAWHASCFHGNEATRVMPLPQPQTCPVVRWFEVGAR